MNNSHIFIHPYGLPFHLYSFINDGNESIHWQMHFSVDARKIQRKTVTFLEKPVF